MDALPTPETTDLAFKSTNDFAHLCGHDMHAVMLLGAAMLLKENETRLNGTVKLMFQPAEETGAGAKAMINKGLLEDPSVDAALALQYSLIARTSGWRAGSQPTRTGTRL